MVDEVPKVRINKMEAKFNRGIRIRRDDFGGICYVPHRDDFFAVDKPVFSFIESFSSEWKKVDRGRETAAKRLAKVGILETRKSSTRELPYSGPSFIGNFEELVTISEPLVVNCFSTSICPMACVYCHADDLMKQRRDDENENEVSKVISTASAIPAIVAVVTGGDPLSMPHRARKIIENLSPQKAIVLDTSGAGDLDELLPILIEHDVHVRISLDSANQELNDGLRPINPKYFGRKGSSFREARSTIDKCVEAGLSVTVQSVITSRNDREDELINVRDLLKSHGVKNWVLHIAIEGGSARRLAEAQRRQDRPLSIIPQPPRVHGSIRNLIQASEGVIDIRCTDTGSTPNSVLLVDSNGDLFTEGLAKKGKVLLYSASSGRPDELKKKWAHVDRFGHARRYLNWNPWLQPDSNLLDTCIAIKIPEIVASQPGILETEAKYQVANVLRLKQRIVELGGGRICCSNQRDEYYDSPGRSLAAHDFVVRLRYIDDDTLIALKGRRFESGEFDISRIELEFPVLSKEAIQADLLQKQLEVTWYFEKKRESFRINGLDVLIELDEIPDVGFYVEFEGPSQEIRRAEKMFEEALGQKERRNYKEIYVAFRASQGAEESTVLGAEF